MHSKKGELATKSVAEIALILFGAFAVVFVGASIFGGGSGFFEGFGCKVSVYFSDQTHGLMPPICYTQDRVIETTDKDKIISEVVENMRSCWNQWGEGDLDPDGENWWVNNEFKCFKCARLKFPEYKNVGDDKISISEFEDYLEDTNNKVKGYKGTFLNYFDNRVMFSFPGEYANDMIRSDEEYAVTFVENIKSNDLIRYSSRITTVATSAAVYCAVSGVGTPATPACAAIGGVAGLVFAMGEDVIDWISGVDDKDIIRVSRFDDIKLCKGVFS